MEYIITDKKNKITHRNVILDNTTEIGSRLEYDNKKYLVKQITINPDKDIIELKCNDISNAGKKSDLTVRVR